MTLNSETLKFMFTQPEGRITRQTWWIGVLILLAADIVVNMLLGHGGLIRFVITILFIIAGVMLHIKRCHDRGKSGLWVLLLIIPVVGFIWAIIDLGLLEGDRDTNEYGPPPAD